MVKMGMLCDDIFDIAHIWWTSGDLYLFSVLIMKKFILRILYVFVGSCVFLVLLDLIVSKGLQQSKDYRFQVWTDIMQDSINADVIF